MGCSMADPMALEKADPTVAMTAEQTAWSMANLTASSNENLTVGRKDWPIAEQMVTMMGCQTAATTVLASGYPMAAMMTVGQMAL
jgi:hypothetical protein